MAYALMQAIHHLRDWLINDPESCLDQGVVDDDFINGSRTLRMVADLCYGAKHAVLKNPRHEHRVTILALSASSMQGDITKFVSSPDGHVDVNDFAAAAIDEWDEFLSQRGL